jgi:hypothetical protein
VLELGDFNATPRSSADDVDEEELGDFDGGEHQIDPGRGLDPPEVDSRHHDEDTDYNPDAG